MIRERKEARLVLALAAGANATAAARRAGCSRRTVFRRLQDPSFCRAVGTARGQILSRATARLARTSTQAVATLEKLLDDGSASVRRMAAKSLLDSLARLTDLAEVEERIAELETASGLGGEVQAMRNSRQLRDSDLVPSFDARGVSPQGTWNVGTRTAARRAGKYSGQVAETAETSSSSGR